MGLFRLVIGMRYARSGIIIQLNNVKNAEFQHPDSKNDAVLMPVIKTTTKNPTGNKMAKTPSTTPNSPLFRTIFFFQI